MKTLIDKIRSILSRANNFIQLFDPPAPMPCIARITFLENRIEQLESLQVDLSTKLTTQALSTTTHNGVDR